MKRLYLDIETSPNVVLSWRVGYKINIDHDNIITERRIICVGYKWANEKAAKVIVWDRNQDDKAMLTKVAALMQEADEIVAHNGDNFDIPWLRTRFAFHHIPPPPPIKSVDTLQWSKRRMLFNSNKLDYIAGYLGFGRKIKTEFGLWKAVMLDNDRSALKRMADYCARDVELLQRVHEAIEPYAGVVKTHVGVLAGGERWTCPRTGSKNVQARGKVVTASGTVQYRMRNNETGRWFTISESAHKAYKAWVKKQKEKDQ